MITNQPQEDQKPIEWSPKFVAEAEAFNVTPDQYADILLISLKSALVDQRKQLAAKRQAEAA